MARQNKKRKLILAKLRSEYDDERQRRKDESKFLRESHATFLRCRELEILARQEDLRPHQVYRTNICWDATELAYCCYLLVSDDFDTDDEDAEGFLVHQRTPIVGYGSTPAEACDNFDHEWLHGRKNES